MTRELEQKIINHSLTYEDVVMGETYYGNPEWNPEILDYLLDTGYSPFDLWRDNQLDKIDKLRGHQYHLNGMVRSRKRTRLRNG